MLRIHTVSMYPRVGHTGGVVASELGVKYFDVDNIPKGQRSEDMLGRERYVLRRVLRLQDTSMG